MATNTSPILAMARQVTTQLQEYVRERIEPIYRGYKLLPKLKAAGRISSGHGGQFMEMHPRKRRRTISGGSGNVLSIAFPATNVHDVITLPWREYKLAESQSQFEDLASRPQAVRFFKNAVSLTTECVDDFMADLPPKFYLDGNANSTDIHGFESFCGSTGSCIASSVLVNPSDTFAGKSTALGVTGSWTGNYPQGVGNTEYNWFSPFLVDYNNVLLQATSPNWANNWQYALNYAMTYMFKLQNIEPNTCVIDAELLRKAKDSFIGVQQIEVVRTASDRDPAIPRQFYNGVELITEYGCPSAVGYLFDIKNITLKHFGSDLIQVKDGFNVREGLYEYLFRFFGNLDFKTPAWYAKFLAISGGS